MSLTSNSSTQTSPLHQNVYGVAPIKQPLVERGLLERVNYYSSTSDANYTLAPATLLPGTVFVLSASITANRSIILPTPAQLAAVMYGVDDFTNVTFSFFVVTSNVSFSWSLSYSGWTASVGSVLLGQNANSEIKLTFLDRTGSTGYVSVDGSGRQLSVRNDADITIYGITDYWVNDSTLQYVAIDRVGNQKSSTSFTTLLSDVWTNWVPLVGARGYYRFPGPIYEIDANLTLTHDSPTGAYSTGTTWDWTGSIITFRNDYAGSSALRFAQFEDFVHIGGHLMVGYPNLAQISTYANLTGNTATDPLLDSATYSPPAGSLSLSGNTLTGSGTNFTTAMLNKIIRVGATDYFIWKRNSATSLVVSPSGSFSGQTGVVYPYYTDQVNTNGLLSWIGSPKRFTVRDMELTRNGGITFLAPQHAKISNIRSFFCQGTIQFSSQSSTYPNISNVVCDNIVTSRNFDDIIDGSTNSSAVYSDILFLNCDFGSHPAFGDATYSNNTSLGSGLKWAESDNATYRRIRALNCNFRDMRQGRAIKILGPTTDCGVYNCTFNQVSADLNFQTSPGSAAAVGKLNEPFPEMWAIYAIGVQTNFQVQGCTFIDTCRAVGNFASTSTYLVPPAASTFIITNNVFRKVHAQEQNTSWEAGLFLLDRSGGNLIANNQWQDTGPSQIQAIETTSTSFTYNIQGSATESRPACVIDALQKRVGVNCKSLMSGGPTKVFEVNTVETAPSGANYLDQHSELGSTATYVDFNPGVSSGYEIGAPYPGATQFFMPKYTGYLSQITVWVAYTPAAAWDLIVKIYSGVTPGSVPPGALMGTETFRIPSSGTTTQRDNAVVGSYLLTAGTLYALEFYHDNAGDGTGNTLWIHQGGPGGYTIYPDERGGRTRYKTAGTVSNYRLRFETYMRPTDAGRRSVFTADTTSLTDAATGLTTSPTSVLYTEAHETFSQVATTTTNATPATWGIDCTSQGVNDSCRIFNVYVSAQRTNGAGESAAYVFRDGVITNKSGAVALAVAPSKSILLEDDATWDAGVSLSGNNIVVSMTGAAAQTIVWRSSMVVFNPLSNII